GWGLVADTLRQLHRLTQGWPQRPGWLSSTDRLHAETGTKIDLGAMPPEGVVRCRAAWARLSGRERCVVHGDPNPGNIRMTADRVALIDWDESHVDVPDLDLVLPHNAAGLDDDTHDVAAQARAAWEAAVCWDPSGTDEFAVKRLADVRAVSAAAANRQSAPNAARRARRAADRSNSPRRGNGLALRRSNAPPPSNTR